MADPVLESALGQSTVLMAFAVKLSLASTAVGRDIFLLDGSGELTISGDTYVGIDADFGSIDSIGVISDGSGESAPEIELTLVPNDAATAADLSNAGMQGAEVIVMLAAIDPTTGLPIGTAETKFLGEIDVPRLETATGDRKLVLSIVSIFERLFEVDDGIRATDGFHQSVWPGELGFEYVTGVEKNLYWGSKKPAGYGQPVNGAGEGSFAASWRR